MFKLQVIVQRIEVSDKPTCWFKAGKTALQFPRPMEMKFNQIFLDSRPTDCYGFEAYRLIWIRGLWVMLKHPRRGQEQGTNAGA